MKKTEIERLREQLDEANRRLELSEIPTGSPREIDYKQDIFRNHPSFYLNLGVIIQNAEENLEKLCREAFNLVSDLRMGGVIFSAGSFAVRIGSDGLGLILFGEVLAGEWSNLKGLHFFTEEENREKTEEFRSTFKTASKTNP